MAAKCWMNGIPAYLTAGLRSNFAGSDLIVDSDDPRRKLLVQVKTGYCRTPERVYFTQCGGAEELTKDKFVADIVVLVNIDYKVGAAHQHQGTLDFHHLAFYVMPCDKANELYLKSLRQEHQRPLKTGGQGQLSNLAVYVPAAAMAEYRDGWSLMAKASNTTQLPPMADDESEHITPSA